MYLVRRLISIRHGSPGAWSGLPWPDIKEATTEPIGQMANPKGRNEKRQEDCKRLLGVSLGTGAVSSLIASA
jgi:hypothetical protein